jgi:hypothetical protein
MPEPTDAVIGLPFTCICGSDLFEPVVRAQAPHMRVPLADGTLGASRDAPDPT